MPDLILIDRLPTEEPDVRIWLLKRNCSMTPTQLGIAYAILAMLSLSVAGFFWWFGAVMVLPFAALELLVLGVAFLLYCRHATDQERIRLQPDRVIVEWETGGKLLRRDLPREWVRVQSGIRRGELVSLTASGQTVQVGRYVRPDLRDQLAAELRLALCR